MGKYHCPDPAGPLCGCIFAWETGQRRETGAAEQLYLLGPLLQAERVVPNQDTVYLCAFHTLVLAARESVSTLWALVSLHPVQSCRSGWLGLILAALPYGFISLSITGGPAGDAENGTRYFPPVNQEA